MREKKPAADDSQLRITNQARTTTGMMYEFREKDVRLVLAIEPRASEAGHTEWNVRAAVDRNPDSHAIIGQGDTKQNALSQTGLQWDRDAASHGLPPVDWKIVAAALTTVRAL